MPDITEPTQEIEVRQISIPEDQYIAALNAQVQENLNEKPVPMVKLLHISHLDLDGYGATILSQLLQKFYPEGAMELETRNILPNKLNSVVEEALADDSKYSMIVITDLAVNQALVDMINNHPSGHKVRVFDHHITNVTDLPENFVVTENSPIHEGKLTCATELYYNYIRNDTVYGLIHDENVRKAIAYFVECVRVYDTFEFWGSRNDEPSTIDMTYFDAPRLNILFHVEERSWFIQYIFDHVLFGQWKNLTISTEQYFWISRILEIEQNKNAKYVESTIRRMCRVPFKFDIYRNGKIFSFNYENVGVIFAEKSSPVIANTALERFPELDFCAVVSNNQISLYSNKEKIDVSAIASLFGGGGHKEAAGFTIPYISASVLNMDHFSRMIECAGNIAPEDLKFEGHDVTDTN